MVDDGVPLFGREGGQGGRQVQVPTVGRASAGGLGKHLDGEGCASRRAGDVDRLAVRDGDQPRLHVRVGRQVGVGAKRGQERLGPRVIGVDGAEDRSTDTQDRRTVGLHDRVERWFSCHAWQTTARSGM